MSENMTYAEIEHLPGADDLCATHWHEQREVIKIAQITATIAITVIGMQPMLSESANSTA